MSLPPPFNPIPAGKKRICVAAFQVNSWIVAAHGARMIAAEIQRVHPDEYETWFYFTNKDNFYSFLKEKFDPVPFPEHLKGHETSPFVWIGMLFCLGFYSNVL